MQYKHSRLARSWLRSFLYFVFSKCGRSIVRHILPVFLCCLVVAVPATVQSYAAGAEGTDDINAMDLTYHSLYYVNGVQQPLPVVRNSGEYYGKQAVYYQLPVIAAGVENYNHKGVLAYTLKDFVGNHEYHLNFDFLVFKAGATIFSAYLRFKDGNGNEIKQQNIYMNGNLLDETWQTVDVNFIANTNNISSGYTVELVFEFVDSYRSANAYYITQQIYLNDNDDDKSLLDSILSWLSRIYHFIAGGTDRDGVTHEGLVQGIKNGLNSLGTRIGNFFTTLGDNLSGWFTDLKDSIINKIQQIKQWFIDLGNDIIDGLKSLFIPSDGYFAEKKTQLENFVIEHFGALYQGPDVMIDLIRKLLTVNPSANPGITMPAIEFDFLGQHYNFSESIHYSFSWVNDSSHPLYYFYHIYRGFVTVILFVGFGNYLVKKYRDVFEGGGDGE